MNLLSLINANNFGTFNKCLAKKIGLHETIFLHALVAKYEQTAFSGGIQEDGSFYFTLEDAQEETCLGERSQNKAIGKLESLGICKKFTRGLPAKRHFYLYPEKIWEALEIQKSFTNSCKTQELDPAKRRNYILRNAGTHHIYENKNKNKEREADASTQAPIFSYKRVKMELKAYEKLIEDVGKEKMDEMLERLDEYADINPKRFKQYANHATVIRKWLREEKPKPTKKQNSVQEILGKLKEKHLHLFRKNEIEILKDSICFKNGTFYLEILFEDPYFHQKLIRQLQKMGIFL